LVPSKQKQMEVKALATVSDTLEQLSVKTLLDSGATMSCVDEGFVEALQLLHLIANQAIEVRNANNSLNRYIKECVELVLTVLDKDNKEHNEVITLPIVDLGRKFDVFLGYDWLHHHNPVVDWRKNNLDFSQCPQTCQSTVYIRSLEGFQLPAQYGKYAMLFEKDEFDQLPE